MLSRIASARGSLLMTCKPMTLNPAVRTGPLSARLRPSRRPVTFHVRPRVAPVAATSSSLGPMTKPVVSCRPDAMGGIPVFVGTRVPVQTLFDYLEAGDSIDELLAGFPSVSRELVIEFLEQAKERLVAAASRRSSSTSASTGVLCGISSATR